jgi:hypothetical protein
MSYILDPTGDGEVVWLSSGGLRYLRRGGYDPENQHRISSYLIEALRVQGHLMPLAVAPKTGELDEDFNPARSAVTP